MSSYRKPRSRGGRGNFSVGANRVPTESEFVDLLTEAIPDVVNTAEIYKSIESGTNRGFKNLSDAERALNDKLKFDKHIQILENQLNQGGTVAVEAKGKLGHLLISHGNSS